MLNLLAQSGCCSYHGGVCGCSNGRQLCCDGTLSPSCTCYSPPPKPVVPITPFVPSCASVTANLSNCIRERDVLKNKLSEKDTQLTLSSITVSEKNQQIDNQTANFFWLAVICIILFFVAIHYYRKSKSYS
jgi:hypothetical protein